MSAEELIRRVSDLSANEKAVVQLYRNGKKMSVTVKLGQNPEQVFTGGLGPNTKPESSLDDYGLGLSQYSSKLAEKLNLKNLKRSRPVIVNVARNSTAYRSGLAPGDIILDVNKTPVYTIRDAKKHLERGRVNLLRILRGEQVFLVYLRP